MKTEAEYCVSEGSCIYTLAESGTQKKEQTPPIALIAGKGTDISDNKTLANRARRKLITRKMVLSLIDVAKEKGEPERVQAYWNAYHCLNNVVVSNGRMHGKYCKNRFCTICNAIRKAEMINRYYPIISQWEDVQFVTLTVKACKEEKLNRWIYGMKRAFKLILERCNKRHQRGKGIKLTGIKSLECNFNPERKTYNPHYHLIVPNREIAELLKKEWIEQWRPRNKNEYRYKFTTPKAQHIEPVYNLHSALIETIKYGSKIFTEPDLNKKSQQKIPPKIYARALDNILVAMKGYRIFDRFGFNLPPKEENRNTNVAVDFENWTFPNDSADWVNDETGEALTGYLPPLQLSYLLNDCIDKNLS
ncbi:MAG: protein rep [Bacteroidales bacterium]|nr:protein rep [Bacteroidales bacterium]MDD3010218.1 protein rep [Bacteroidales bacterium]MDD3962528.1 protein rep [Bacteroidales bacterium]MDY0285820.1 protein rep [Bacteroidales bacterium]HPE87677.1 protein rep [Bacteroidales bacterium]